VGKKRLKGQGVRVTGGIAFGGIQISDLR